MPLLFRESPLNSVWEGSGNVNALDVLRALSREPEVLEAWITEVGAARGEDPHLDRAVDDTLTLLGDVTSLEVVRPPPRRPDGRLPAGLAARPLRAARGGRRVLLQPARGVVQRDVRHPRGRRPRRDRRAHDPGGGLMATREWDASTYDSLPLPHVAWGQRVLDRMRLTGDERVLDAGCGTGRDGAALLERWPEVDLVGIDGSAQMIEQARSRLGDRAELHVADLTEPLPLGRAGRRGDERGRLPLDRRPRPALRPPGCGDAPGRAAHVGLRRAGTARGDDRGPRRGHRRRQVRHVVQGRGRDARVPGGRRLRRRGRAAAARPAAARGPRADGDLPRDGQPRLAPGEAARRGAPRRSCARCGRRCPSRSSTTSGSRSTRPAAELTPARPTPRRAPRPAPARGARHPGTTRRRSCRRPRCRWVARRTTPTRW